LPPPFCHGHNGRCQKQTLNLPAPDLSSSNVSRSSGSLGAFDYAISGVELGQSKDKKGSCHHWVKFEGIPQSKYKNWYVSGPGYTFPSTWGEPGNGNLYAGYHHLGHADCDQDTENSANMFTLYLYK
jgi:hypothetical protein